MPRVKSHSPISLFKLCAEFVACNLDHWSNPSDTELNMCNQEATCSPLDKLPWVLLEEVIHFVRHLPKASSSPYKMILKKQLLELLITPHSKSLDLSMGELNEVPYILNLASLRCPDLQTVRIVSPLNCIDMCVHLCAMKFERLHVLNISETDAGDNCLQILGMHCKELRELNVSQCEKITDAGIQGLCVSVNYLGKEDPRLGQCKSIETLFIRGTKITKKGIQTALINLPFLKQCKIDILNSANVPVQFLAEMHQPDWNIKRPKDIRKYSLDSLYLCHEILHDGKLMSIPYTSGSLGLVASLCPSVTSLKIVLIKGLTDREMLGLLSLKNVNILEITHNVINDVTFEGGVVPLLKRFGSSLKELKLCGLMHVNTRAIIDFCPKLQSLSLWENDYIYSTTVRAKEDAEPYHSKQSRMERKPLVLKNLEKLCVVYPFYEDAYLSEENEISSEYLLSFFSSPSLIDIDIQSCSNLTDCVFERASKIHQFLSLEKLSISDCQSLTRRGIDVVMNNKTPLSEIKIYSCHILAYDIDWFFSNARSEKWDLSLQYFHGLRYEI